MNSVNDYRMLRQRYWLLLALSAFLYVSFLGIRDFWYPDEPDIAQVAQAMYTSGDWVAPRRNGQIWVDYPPLLYWAGCACSLVLGGLSEFSLRLASALGAIALVLWTAVAASRWFGARAGLWAGLMLATCSGYVYGAISYRPDMLFSLAIAGALFAYAAGSSEQSRWGPRVAAFALLGVALLAKGPLGLLLPGLVLTLWHATRREWKRLLQLAPLSLVALAVATPWCIACARAMGQESFWGEIYAQNFGRYESGSRGHGKPLHYYLLVVWLDLGPWVFLLPFAIRWLVRTGRWRDRRVQLLMWWLGTFFVFLSLAATKRQVYLMPAYPAAMLLLAPWVAELLGSEPGEAPAERPARWFLKGYVGVMLLTAAVALTAGVLMERILPGLSLDASAESAVREARVPALGSGLLCLALGLWIRSALRAGAGGAIRTAFVRVAASLPPVYVAVMAWVTPTFNAHKTYAPQSAWISEQIPGNETHVGLYFPERNIAKMGAFGFYTGRLVSLVWNTWDLEAFFEEHPDSVALVSDTVSEELFTEDAKWRDRVIREMEAGRYRYFVVGGS